jgi:hypothetical protein
VATRVGFVVTTKVKILYSAADREMTSQRMNIDLSET